MSGKAMSAPGRVQDIKKQFEDAKDSDSPYYRGGPLLLSKPREVPVANAPAAIKRSPAFRNDKVVPRKTPVPTPRTGALVVTPKPAPFKKSPSTSAIKNQISSPPDSTPLKSLGQVKMGDNPPKRVPFAINSSSQKAAVQLSRVLVESNSKILASKVSNSARPNLPAQIAAKGVSPTHQMQQQSPKLVKMAPAKNATNNAKNSTPKLTTFSSPKDTSPQCSPPDPKVAQATHQVHQQMKEILSSPLPKGPPPQKPPRTFAHSLNFFEQKGKEEKRPPVRSASGPLKPSGMKRPTVPPPAMPARSKTESQIVRKNKNKTKELLAACVRAPPQYVDPANSELSRSQSMEHVYAVPFVPKVEAGIPIHIPIELTRTNKQGLYYMSTPIQWPARPTNLPVTSFNPQRSPKTSPPCAKVLPTLRESPKVLNDPMMDHNRIQLLVNEAFNSVQLSTPDPSTDSEDCLSPIERDLSIMDRSSPSEDDNEEEAKRVVERRKGYVKRASSFAMSQTRVPLDKTNQLFECVLLVGLHLDQDTKSYKPYIKSKFPANAKVPENIKLLVFPDSEDWPPNEGSEHKKPYSLVLTSDLGHRSYGYCKRVVPEGTNLCLPLAYCIYTKHRASGFFYKLLSEIESRHGQPDAARISMLSSLQLQHLPKLGCPLIVPSVTITRPPDQRLEDSELSALFSCLPSKLLLKLVASVLHERQVVLVSSSLNKLTSCVTALQAALEPFQWQHTLVAALPSCMTEICNAPTPYIVGVLKTKTGVIPTFSIDEGMAIDLDFGKPLQQVGDECKILPGRLQKALNLALQVVASTTAATEPSRNVLVSEAFVRFFVEACGHFRNHIVTQQDGRLVFERESFVKAVESRSLQLFLEWFTETSHFSVFIYDRTNITAGTCYNNSIFDSRVQQNFRESEKNSLQIMKNYKIINKKVKTFGDRIRDLVH